MTLTHLDLDRIDGLAKAATPGKWHSYPDVNTGRMQVDNRAGLGVADCGVGQPFSGANAAFIAALDPTTVLSLITRIRELEGALEPFANLELPKHRPEGTTGFYSIRFSAIEAVRTALQR